MKSRITDGRVILLLTNCDSELRTYSAQLRSAEAKTNLVLQLRSLVCEGAHWK